MSFAASAWRISRWNRRHSSCWRILRDCGPGTVCAAYAQRTDGTFLEGAAKEAAEARCIDAGLAGIHLLWQVDTGGGDTLAARGDQVGRQAGWSQGTSGDDAGH